MNPEELQIDSLSQNIAQRTKKGILIVLLANTVAVLLNGVLNFLLPKHLSIESYGQLKEYQLWISYIGILAFGYMDGVYLKYGGKSIPFIDKNELVQSHRQIRGYHLILMGLLLLLGIIMGNPIAICIGVIIYPYNMSNYFRTFFQATGEFKKYGIVLTMIPIMTFVLDAIAIFVLKSDSYIVYIAIIILTSLVGYLYLESIITKHTGLHSLFGFNIGQYFSIAKSGLILNISNFSSTLLTSVDRWFIVSLMTIKDFSIYSFAATIEALFNTCTSPVTITLYNYFCTNDNAKNGRIVSKVNDMCVVSAILLISFAFPCKLIINIYLTKYLASINIIFVLLSAHAFYFVIKAIYVNLQKALGEQNVYFKHISVVLILAVIMNAAAYYVTKSVMGFALATLATSIIWFFMCLFRYRNIFINYKSVITQLFAVIAFIIIGIKTNAISGFVIYISFVVIISLVLMKEAFLEVISSGLSRVQRIKNRQ